MVVYLKYYLNLHFSIKYNAACVKHSNKLTLAYNVIVVTRSSHSKKLD